VPVIPRKMSRMGGPRVTRHIPARSCVACRETKPKRELIRLVYGEDGKVEIDPSGKRAGRGAYLCYTSDCWEKGLKKGRLEHALRGRIDPESWAELQEFGRTLSTDYGNNS